MNGADYRVEIGEEEVACVDPGGRRHAVSWNALESVRVVTTGSGPAAPEVLWVLEAGRARCVVPQSAAGEPELLARLERLPGFDRAAVVAALDSPGDASFPCWRRHDDGVAAAQERRGLSGAEKLALVTAGLGVLHHADHVLRVDHNGWPFRPQVTPFTLSLLVYAVVALLLALRRSPRLRVALALALFLVPTLAHVFLETPIDQFRTWAERPDVNLLGVASPALGAVAVAVGILLSAFAFATLVGFWREARRPATV
ncbi:MAG TPA: hypothetical protein VF121_11325 [Thermoanaerobaculia bacterium]|nr:hypothetical protein [Thermoanaerobaculia bacterium]